MNIVRRVFLAPIHFYQRHISPHFPAVCRYTPTCSAYTAGAIERFGVVRGIWLGSLRICRCNPLSKGGWDPVPLEFDILGRQRIPQPDPLSPVQRMGFERYGWLLAARTKYHGRKTRKPVRKSDKPVFG